MAKNQQFQFQSVSTHRLGPDIANPSVIKDVTIQELDVNPNDTREIDFIIEDSNFDWLSIWCHNKVTLRNCRIRKLLINNFSFEQLNLENCTIDTLVLYRNVRDTSICRRNDINIENSTIRHLVLDKCDYNGDVVNRFENVKEVTVVLSSDMQTITSIPNVKILTIQDSYITKEFVTSLQTLTNVASIKFKNVFDIYGTPIESPLTSQINSLEFKESSSGQIDAMLKSMSTKPSWSSIPAHYPKELYYS